MDARTARREEDANGQVVISGDEGRALALYRRGMRPEEIASTLAIPPETLSALLKRWRRELRDERRAEQSSHALLAVESVRAICAEAWAAFEREREIERATLAGELDHVKRRVTRPTAAREGGSASEETLIEELERPRLTNQGPRYLSVALAAQREIARLLGLYDEAGKDREPVEILITRNPPWPEPDPSDWLPEDEEGSPAAIEPAGGGEITTGAALAASAEPGSTRERDSQIMQETFLPGRVDRESEFVAGLTGTCGPNAAAMAERWSDQSQLNTLDVYHRMRAANRCDPNGAATMAALADDARAAGYSVDLLPYREPTSESDWRAFFERHVGQRAVVYETAYGQALHDAISGLGENARDLHYHFVMIAGWHPGGHSARAGRNLPPGWWCADGANFAGGNALQFYPDDVLVASRPCAAMAIAPRVTAPTSGPTHVPVGWHDDGHTLTALNGHRVILGFREYVLTQPAWAPENVPLEDERHSAEVQPGNPAQGAGQRQVFLRLALEWTQAGGVRAAELGPETLALEAAVEALRARVASAESQLQAALAQAE